MFALDLFNTKYEQDLREGAVDDLEARRIDTLNDRMQELLARAREPAYKTNPAALASLKKQFQQIKDERDSYYKVREGSVTPTATGLRHHARPENYGGYEPETDPLAKLDKSGTNKLEKAMGVRFDREKKYQGGLDVDEAGIPGNIPTEKIPGKEDLLKGKGRSYYEDQKKSSDEIDEHGGGIGPRQHWQDLMPEQSNPDDDDWYDEDQDTELRSGDYVRDTMDGESGEVFKMQGDPTERRVQILDRDGRGWYIAPDRLTAVDRDDPAIQKYFGKKRVRDMDEDQWDSGEDVTVTQDDQNTTYQYKGNKFVVSGEEAQGEAWWYEPGDTWREADHYNYVYDESKGINRFYNEDGQNVFNLSATNQNKVEQFVKAKAKDFVSTMAAQPNLPAMNEQGVAEATGDSKFDAMMGNISKDPWTQLNSDPNWESEIEDLVDQHIEPWLLAMEKSGMPITRDGETLNPGWRKRYEQVSTQLAQKYLASKKFNPRDPDMVGRIRAAIDWHTDENRNVAGQLSAYANDLPMHRYADAFDAGGQTANMRDAMAGLAPRDDDDDGYAPRPEANPRRLDPGNMEEAVSRKDLLKQVGDKLNDPEFRKQPADTTKSFTKGDHYTGPGPDDYGYTGYQGHGMPTDRAERASIRADKKKGVEEGWSDAIVSRRTGTPRTPYSVYIKGRKWKDFESDDHAEAVANKLRAKFKAEGRDPSVITVAPTDIPKSVAEEVDKVGALKAAQAAAKFMIRNLDDRAALKDYSMHFWSPAKFYQGATMAMRGAGVDEIVRHITQDRPAQFEQDQTPGFGEFPPKQEITIIPPKKLKSGETYQDQNKYWQSQGQAPIYKTNEVKADPTGSWVVYGGNKVVKFKTHTGAKAYAEKNGGKVASSEHYQDKIQKSGVGEAIVASGPSRPLDDRAVRKMVWDTMKINADTGEQAVQRALAVLAKKPQSRMVQDLQDKFQSLADRLAQGITEDQDTSGVERAILNRIMVAHTDLLMKFGPDKVMQAAEEVAYNVGDVDEIGTSDVSAYVNQVKQILGAVAETQVNEKWSAKYKSSINCSNPKGFSQKAHCVGRKK
jgi:hypothetical protein